MSTDKRRKLVVSAVVSVVVFIAAIAIDIVLVRTRPMPEEISTQPRPLRVQTYTVKPHDLTEQIVGYGSARSLRTTHVTAQVAGTLVYRDKSAREGQRVKQGQVLFKIDNRDYTQTVIQLTERIASQKAQLDQLNLDQAHCQTLLAIAQSAKS